MTGPDDDTREEGVCYVWGEVSNGEKTVRSRVRTPEGYTLTADASVRAAMRVRKDSPAGYHTPATAFSPEFTLELDGVEGFIDD